MVKDDQAVIEADVAVWKLQIVESPPGKSGFHKTLESEAPEAEATSQLEWKVQFIQNFESCHQGIEKMPGISELNRCLSSRARLAAGPKRTEPQEGVGRYERIPGGRGLEERGSQQDDALERTQAGDQ